MSAKDTVSKIRAFFQEFPFLGGLVSETSIFSVRVSRINEKILEIEPKDVFRALDELDVSSETNVWMCDGFGRLITVVNKPKDRLLFSKPGETVRQALERIGDRARDVFYIVVVTNSDLTLYKTPKDWTLPDWIAHTIAEHRQAIRMEVTNIDAEGARLNTRA